MEEESPRKIKSFGISNIEAYESYKFARHLETQNLYVYRNLSKEEKKGTNFEEYIKLKNDNLLSFKKEGDLIFWEFCNGGNLKYFNNFLNFKQNLLTEIYIQKIVKEILNGIESLNNKAIGGIALSNIFIHFPAGKEPVIGKNEDKYKKYYQDFINDEDSVNFNIKIKYFTSLVERKNAIEYNGFDGDNSIKNYMAPEILNNLIYNDNNKNPIAANIWSLGVIIFILLTGNKSPFEGNTIQNVSINIGKKDIFIPSDLSPSFQILDFMLSLLKYKPEERPTLERIKKHEFLKKVPVEFDFLNLNLLCKIEKYMKLNIDKKDTLFSYLTNTNLQNKIEKNKMLEAQKDNIINEIMVWDKLIAQFKKELEDLNQAVHEEKDLEFIIQSIKDAEIKKEFKNKELEIILKKIKN